MMSGLERFEAKVARRSSGCHEWTGSTNWRGYGGFYWKGKRVHAHRVAFELFCKPIPPGMHVLHTCDNRLCVNPEHLFLGTPADNTHDMMAKGRAIYAPCKGEAHGGAILSERDVQAIRLSAESNRVLAQRYGVGETTIWQARTGRSWRHL